MPSGASVLVKDLANVPSIVGALGLSIAEAQKAFNLDYLESLERLLAMTKSLLGETKAGAAAGADPVALDAKEKEKLEAFKQLVFEMIKSCAPSRYQFTETTLKVRMDLAQSLDVGANVGFGLALGAVAVNAGLSIGFGYDYRAAAECHTVIHAIPADSTAMQTLLSRAKELNDKALELPERSTVDSKVLDQAATIFEKMVGAAPAKVKTK